MRSIQLVLTSAAAAPADRSPSTPSSRSPDTGPACSPMAAQTRSGSMSPRSQPSSRARSRRTSARLRQAPGGVRAPLDLLDAPLEVCEASLLLGEPQGRKDGVRQGRGFVGKEAADHQKVQPAEGLPHRRSGKLPHQILLEDEQGLQPPLRRRLDHPPGVQAVATRQDGQVARPTAVGRLVGAPQDPILGGVGVLELHRAGPGSRGGASGGCPGRTAGPGTAPRSCGGRRRCTRRLRFPGP